MVAPNSIALGDLHQHFTNDTRRTRQRPLRRRSRNPNLDSDRLVTTKMKPTAQARPTSTWVTACEERTEPQIESRGNVRKQQCTGRTFEQHVRRTHLLLEIGVLALKTNPSEWGTRFAARCGLFPIRPYSALATDAGRKGGANVPPEKRSFYQDPQLAIDAGRKGGHAVHGGTPG
jgi:hypothetical protein